MARKTKEEALETRNAILDATVRVFAAKGAANASLTDIAREAGVTRGAIYWHFTNKADLLNALWDEVLLLYTPLARASESRDEPDPLGRLRELYVRFLGRLADDPRQQQLIRILFDQGSGSEDIDLIRTRHLQNSRTSATERGHQLRNAIDRGQLSPDLDVRLGTIGRSASFTGSSPTGAHPGVRHQGDAPALIEDCCRCRAPWSGFEA